MRVGGVFSTQFVLISGTSNVTKWESIYDLSICFESKISSEDLMDCLAKRVVMVKAETVC